jgi:aldehyde dehydrogenase (NAD+)
MSMKSSIISLYNIKEVMILGDYMEILKIQKESVTQRPFLTLNERLDALKKLKDAIITNEKDILHALFLDLHKSPFEAYTTEIGYILKNINYAMKHLKSWMKTKKVKTPFFLVGAKSHVSYIPYGHVLLIGPYNYPFQLVMEPLIGAISAGNVVTIKPSELTPHTEALIKKIISEVFDPTYISVITGGVEVTQEILKHPFDYIFFTGSTRVGQIVYEQAAKHLTPVTLELGGKSPVIVDDTANITLAAKRIVYGKMLNAGQTCIAPDFIYVDVKMKDRLIKEMIKAIDLFSTNPLDSAKIVSENHVKRLDNLINPKKVVYEGSFETSKVKPYILSDVSFDDLVMRSEIFGPILPVITFNSLDEVITNLKNFSKPLALYMFSESKSHISYVFDHVSFGGGAINDTILHITNQHLPFGGIGESGIGSYTGKYSFYTFSHARGVMKSSTKIDFGIAYPPYTEKKFAFVKKALK